jgi:hypothetical protein
MKIDWKNLSIAMIISIIVTVVSGLILSLSNIIMPKTHSPSGNIPYTIVEANPNIFWLYLSSAIVIELTCILVLTLIFYFLIGYLSKKK